MRLLEELSGPRGLIVLLVLFLIAVGGFLLVYTLATASTKAPSPGKEILIGAGDIADCFDAEGPGSTDGIATARLLDRVSGTVFTMGDNVYESGTDAEFEECYEPSWGRHKARTYPSVGNHEYHTAGASGYFDYFGAAAGDPEEGYYSYDLDQWHVVVLNSMCEEVGGCQDDSPMLAWLEEDLTANPKTCTVAYWHHPLFSSGEHGNNANMRPAWDALYAANVDVVVNGHDHDYERFAPQDPTGTADSEQGIRQFVVGTGGASLRSFEKIKSNSEIRNADTYGVLKLALHSTGYDWEFLPVAGKTFTDSGSDSCH